MESRIRLRDFVPELVVACLALVFWLLFRQGAFWLGETYLSLDIQYRLAPAVLMGGLCWWFVNSRVPETLLPPESAATRFQVWSMYDVFSAYVRIGTAIVGGSALILLLLTFAQALLLSSVIGGWLVGSVGVGLVAGVTTYDAGLKLRAHLLRHFPPTAPGD